MFYQVLFFGTWGYGRERNGLLGNILNSDKLALTHLIPALTHFYIGMTLASAVKTRTLIAFSEVEQTGASSQFYDKFSELVAYLYGLDS